MPCQLVLRLTINEQDAVIQGIIASAIACRTDIYKREGLVGEVDGHGNDRIRAKMDQILKAMARDYGVGMGDIKGSKGSEGKKRKVGGGKNIEHGGATKKVKNED
jgi:hypothetical protein